MRIRSWNDLLYEIKLLYIVLEHMLCCFRDNSVLSSTTCDLLSDKDRKVLDDTTDL